LAAIVDAEDVPRDEVVAEGILEAVVLEALPQAADMTIGRPTATTIAIRRRSKMVSRPRTGTVLRMRGSRG
jgi:hypothetical protein